MNEVARKVLERALDEERFGLKDADEHVVRAREQLARVEGWREQRLATIAALEETLAAESVTA